MGRITAEIAPGTDYPTLDSINLYIGGVNGPDQYPGPQTMHPGATLLGDLGQTSMTFHHRACSITLCRACSKALPQARITFMNTLRYRLRYPTLTPPTSRRFRRCFFLIDGGLYFDTALRNARV